MVDAKRFYPHRLAKSAFTVGSNVLGRTWRHTNKNVTRARRHFLHRARYSGAGRAVLAVTEALTSPRDAIQRRNAAAAYNRTHADTRLDRRDIILRHGFRRGVRGGGASHNAEQRKRR